MANTYALLVGINNYPIKPLQGCINDVKAMKDFLESFYGKSKTGELHIKTLTDNDTDKPTRENLIKGFDFFEPAEADDVCIFYYSGHGSFSYAPEAVESDTGFVQSFVCMDSRLPGGKDLVDKEMSYLVWKTMKNKPDVSFIAITDCCHSGTIMKEIFKRDITERMLPGEADHVPLTVEDYLGYGADVDGENGYEEIFAGNKRIVHVKQGNNIHLAASRDNQTSKELNIDGEQRGAFTHSLLKILYQCGAQVSYKNLVDQAAALVKNLVPDQQPDVNINGFAPGESDAQKSKLFLSQQGGIQNVKYLVFHDPKFGWCIKAGLVHGISKGDKVIIEGLCSTIVTASPTPDISVLMSKPELGSSDKTYFATVKRQPNQSLKFSIDSLTDTGIRKLLEDKLAASPSPFISLLKVGTGRYIIQTNNAHEVFIAHPGSTAAIFKPLPVKDEAGAAYFMERLEIVCRWLHLLEFANAATQLTNKHYSIELYENTSAGNYLPDTFKKTFPIEPINDLFYKKEGETWYQPAFRLSVTNHLTTGSIWITNAYLGFDYSITTDFFSPMEVGPGNTVWLNFTKNNLPVDVIKMKVDAKYQQLGYNEITEYIKLFIAGEKIDTGNLHQGGVDLPALRQIEFKNFNLRSPGDDDDNSIVASQAFWTSETLGFRIIKPQADKDLLDGSPVNLGPITIIPPSGVTGKAGISSSSHTSKSADLVRPPHAAHQNSYLEPFDLLPGTRAGITMDVLELSDIKNKELVSADNPMIIQLATGRSFEEQNILPIGYDAETKLYYPLGYTNDAGDIVIETLPGETPTDAAITKRSFLGSIKIYFQKVIGSKLGLKYDYPRLAIATVNDELTVQYESDTDKVKSAVAGASNILIFIHGIIGDTEGMVKCIKTRLDETGSSLEKKSDLVLTFDYENLNTKIEETARLLKDRLEAVGLNSNNGKKVVIIAHSMGGMVSRWFIEREGGNKVVTKLFMLGTPNNGTPWSDVRDLAETLFTYAINGAAFLKPWMFVLSLVGKLVKGTQETLKQMDSETGMYPSLNAGIDPNLPYIIIAGNTQSIVVEYESTATLITRLFTRIKKKGMYDALDVVLFKKPNDIAVTDESIITLKNAENWQLKPVIYEVASDHLNYFVTQKALLLIDHHL